MTLYDTRTSIEVIDRAGCLELLAGEVIGRIAIIEGTSPLVLPVNYGIYRDQVFFRTGPGSKLASSHGGSACFEIDRFDRSSRSGWSVVVRGRLDEVTASDRDLVAHVEELAEPWTRTTLDHIVRLAPTIITGRRIRPAPGSDASTSSTGTA